MTLPSEPDTEKEPPQIRFLRRLVTTLTVVMLGGVLVIISLLVIRLSPSNDATGNQTLASPPPRLPAELSLPDGVTAQAITFGTGWIAVVTQDNRILILDPDTGDIRQSLHID